MTLLAWDERFSVGVPSIDAQHKLLIEALNELHAAVMQGAERNQVGRLLRSLVGYLRNHWVAEERIMAQVDYPDLEQHRASHRALSHVILSLLTRFERGTVPMNPDSLHILRDCLTNHMRTVDSGYRPWVIASGLDVAEAAAQGQTSNESWVEENNDAGLASEANS